MSNRNWSNTENVSSQGPQDSEGSDYGQMVMHPSGHHVNGSIIINGTGLKSLIKPKAKLVTALMKCMDVTKAELSRQSQQVNLASSVD